MEPTGVKDVDRKVAGTGAELTEMEVARRLKRNLHEKLPKLSPRGQSDLREVTKALLGLLEIGGKGRG